MGDLAAGLNISLSTLSRQLNQAKTATLIEVAKVPGNSAKTIRLNETGWKQALALKKVLADLQERIFGDWVTQDVTRFSEQLVEISGRLQASDEQNQ
ncbi:MAG: MarR family winged helix-turn-helix transcriptional regulator [Lactobacillus sp.]|nr:MarR family winged helix-turn-helix transcriptional regulator [Lactobacillus sp.]